MKKYGNINYRAGRYVYNVHIKKMGFSQAREVTKLPHILAAAINFAIFTEDHKLRIPLEKLQSYIDMCLFCYREYYRRRMKARYEAAHQ